ncbi:hypothetical protein ABH966_004681 [Lysinibacillus sp. RC46]|uniref:hypothetical protein n=1 Tax=unclassified Lysinibacillus TaxID=2636778 RepID=UPI003517F4F1
MNNKSYTSKIFIQTETFLTQWAKNSLTDEELRELEFEIGNNGEYHDFVEGTGGVKKFRFSPSSQNRSKSHAYRVYYLPMDHSHFIFLMTVYDKKVKINLTKAERNAIKTVVQRLKASVRSKTH